MDHGPPIERDEAGRFRPGSGGRKRGSKHKINRVLRECIILAAAAHGEDGKGRGDLVGFLRHVIRRDLKSFVGLMGKLLPVDLHARMEEVAKPQRSFEEVDADLQARGLSGQRLIEMGERMRQREAERARLRNGGDPSLN